jgi:hypothetical protein
MTLTTRKVMIKFMPDIKLECMILAHSCSLSAGLCTKQPCACKCDVSQVTAGEISEQQQLIERIELCGCIGSSAAHKQSTECINARRFYAVSMCACTWRLETHSTKKQHCSCWHCEAFLRLCSQLDNTATHQVNLYCTHTNSTVLSAALVVPLQ